MQRKYPSYPLIGVGALIKKRDEIVIVKREKDPWKGFWSIPGGVLNVGEKLDDAVKREVKEETNLEVEVDRLLDAIDNIIWDAQGGVLYHYVLLDYLCQPIAGELKANTDVREVRWVKLQKLHKFLTTPTLYKLLVKTSFK
jgi:ADP-ribose pyrophosphatase YjhB (NUDIX family)